MNKKNPFGYDTEDIKPPLDDDEAQRLKLEAEQYAHRKALLYPRPRSLASFETIKRFLPIGFNATIPPGGVTTITRQPYLPFRGKILVISDECAPLFSIEELRVGNYNQNIAGSPIPAACLAQMKKVNLLETQEINPLWLQTFGLDMPTCSVGQTIALIVKNVSGILACFDAAIYGISHEL